MLSLDEQIDLLFNTAYNKTTLPKVYQFKTIANDERYSDIPKHRVRIKARYLDVNMDVNDYLTIEFDWINIDILYTVHEMLNSIGATTLLDTDNNMLTVLTAFSGSDILDIVHLESRKICTLFYFDKYNKDEDELVTNIDDINELITSIRNSIVRMDINREYVNYADMKNGRLNYNRLMVTKDKLDRLIQRMEIVINISFDSCKPCIRTFKFISDPDILRIFYNTLREHKFDIEIDRNRLIINTPVPGTYHLLLKYCINYYNEVSYFSILNNAYDYSDNPDDNLVITFKEYIEHYLIHHNDSNDTEEINLRVEYKYTDGKSNEVIYKNTFINIVELIKRSLSNNDVPYHIEDGVLFIDEFIDPSVNEIIVNRLKILNLSNYGRNKYLDDIFIDILTSVLVR